MASEKKITMREYNGTDYDTLYPKTIAEQVDGIYSKDEILSDNTKNVLGISLNSIPDDAFFALAIGVNAFGFRVKVQTSDGMPVAGAEVSGLEQLSTIPLITDENGLTIGISSEDSPTISIKSPYIDQIAPEPRVVSKTNKITDVIFTLSQAPTEMEFLESVENLKFYKASTIDICAVGGGWSGSGGGMNDSVEGVGGSGGAGGGVINALNIEVAKSTPCSIQVAGTGGESIVTCGGQIFSTETATKPAGGSGATKSSTSKAGGSSSVYKFNDTSLGLAGSGGGGGGGHSENTSGASGGTPNGGAGGKGGYDTSRGATNGSAGKFPGGGGGGGGSVYNTVASLTTRGGAGAAGVVWMRIYSREG